MSQILYGEKFKILSKNRNWVKIKTHFDNYIGYIKKDNFYQNFKPTYKVCKLKSKIFRRVKNRYLSTKNFLYFATGISVKNINKNYIEYDDDSDTIYRIIAVGSKPSDIVNPEDVRAAPGDSAAFPNSPTVTI